MKYITITLLLLIIACKNDIKKENATELQTSRVDYLPYYNEESFSPHWITPNSLEEKAFHKIPVFEFTNQLGETVTEKTFDSKIYVADFFFTTCPGICPKMTNNMLKLQEEFYDDPEIMLLSHSVMPKTDSVAALKAYAEEYNIMDGKWHLVTGDRDEIYSLGREAYFVENDLGQAKSDDDFLHTENFLLIDKNRHIRGIYNGLNRASLAQLMIDIKALQLEEI